MKLSRLFTLCILLLAGGSLLQINAQDEPQHNAQDDAHESMVQVSFITPLSTNGIHSWSTINHLSFNMLAGFSGGLEGLEMSGFANVLRWDMHGVQLAGFCNNTFGTAKGIEAAGFYNYNHRKVYGTQVAGFTNLCLEEVEGIQAAGFSNHSWGTTLGQFIGFLNTSLGTRTGLQAAGFANVSTGENKGGQFAGFANVSLGTVTGVQASGFVNYAKKVNGLQVGVVNVADTIEKGVAIGFMSFVKNGYKVIQLGGNETLYGEISFKTGVRSFYNIVSVGAAVQDDEIKWGWGYGIGTLIPVFNKLDLSLEVVSYHINEDRWWSNHVNMLNRANLTANYQFTSMLSAYAGPSWNVWVTDTRNDNSGMNPSFRDWKVFERTNRNTVVSMYPGFAAGIRVGINN